MCVCVVLLKVYCSDHTYTTIRVAVAATGSEVTSAVADKLASNDDLLLVHLSSAGGEEPITSHFIYIVFIAVILFSSVCVLLSQRSRC